MKPNVIRPTHISRPLFLFLTGATTGELTVCCIKRIHIYDDIVGPCTGFRAHILWRPNSNAKWERGMIIESPAISPIWSTLSRYCADLDRFLICESVGG